MKFISSPLLLFAGLISPFLASSQDSTHYAKRNVQIPSITISTTRPVQGMGYLDDAKDGIIYAGKKTELLVLDSADANTATNITRQVMGKIPGAVFSETLGSGLSSTGVGFRGLNASQNREINTRLDGYNITGDVFGYPESYFIPNLDALQRIEVIRGASSLQFGPQFGGVINYVMREAPNKKFGFSTEQTVGNFGTFNSFNSIGGTYKWFSYYGYFQYTHVNGWRPNSDYNQYAGFAKVQFQPIEALKISLEYTALRNRIHMPGGLSDAQFAQDPRASYRTRNWLTTPWNVGAFKLSYQASKNVSLNFTSSLLLSGRSMVWKNGSGGPQAQDTINLSTGTYDPREINRKTFTSTTNEFRISVNYRIRKTENTLAGGLRVYYGKMHQWTGPVGTTGSDFDFTELGNNYNYDLNFTTTNVAPFVENLFRITKRFSVTPGFRFEFINSTAKGYKVYSGNDVPANLSSNRYIPLGGVGLEFKTTSTTSLYGNFTQAYQPITYSQITPFGTTAVIDPNMKDASGFNADLGFRGTVKNFLSFDVDAFWLQYNNRIGTITKQDTAGNNYSFRTNVSNSRHVGAETYVEINPVKAFTSVTKYGTVSFFNSFSFIDARYSEGPYKGKYVENAPRFINRFGVTYQVEGFSVSLLVSHTSKCYTDANNTEKSANANTGVIPKYTVLDLSASYKFLKHYQIKAGINNIADAKYFTKRTNEYPGPGIIPALGRGFYLSAGATF